MTDRTRCQPLVRAAARNNAEWCAAMSRSHGVVGEFVLGDGDGDTDGNRSWTAPTRTPLFHPDAITLAPGADTAALLARIDTTTPGASVKDSFADLDPADMTGAGFQLLFDAQWVHRPASAPAAPADYAWDVVRDPDALHAWAQAWDDGNGNTHLFRPALLDDPATHVLAGRSSPGRKSGKRGSRVVAGAVASRNDRVVGISNIFSLDGGPDTDWPGVLDTVHRLFPALPVVGYEHGNDLTTAVHHGFETLGPLRVWMRSGHPGRG